MKIKIIAIAACVLLAVYALLVLYDGSSQAPVSGRDQIVAAPVRQQEEVSTHVGNEAVFQAAPIPILSHSEKPMEEHPAKNEPATVGIVLRIGSSPVGIDLSTGEVLLAPSDLYN